MLVEKTTNIAHFFKRWKPNNFQSEKQGKPVGEEVDYIEIRIPGDKLVVSKRQATAQDISQYHHEWDLYQRGMEQVAKGTPLCQWPVMEDATIAMLNYHNIHTVEALAALSDAGLQQIGIGARKLQHGAELFLEEVQAKGIETSAENDAVKAENERLVAKVTELETLTKAVDTSDSRVENERLVAKVAELEARMAKQREKIKKQAKKIDTLKLKHAA